MKIETSADVERILSAFGHQMVNTVSEEEVVALAQLCSRVSLRDAKALYLTIVERLAQQPRHNGDWWLRWSVESELFSWAGTRLPYELVLHLAADGGSGSAEAIEAIWVDVGFGAEEVPAWCLGPWLCTPVPMSSDAVRGRAEAAFAWREAGFDAQEASAWLKPVEGTLTPSATARILRDAELSIADAERVVRALQLRVRSGHSAAMNDADLAAWVGLSLPPSVLVAALVAGLSLNEATALRPDEYPGVLLLDVLGSSAD